MALSGEQKNFIKENVKKLSVSQIAAESNLSEPEILQYLKKRWRPEKYEKFMRRYSVVSIPSSFNLKSFLKKNRYIFLLLTFLVVACYANALNNAFVSDDVSAIRENPDIGNIKSIFTGTFIFNPRILLHYLTFHAFGLNPIFYRLPNIFFHWGSTLLIFAILSVISKRNVAIAASLLFAVHPIHVEAISWISGGPYALYTFFFLISLLFYILSKNRPGLVYASAIFFLLAVLSSEKAAPLFLIFPLYELSFGELKKNWKKLLPFFISGLALAIALLGKIAVRMKAVQAMSYEQGGIDNPLLQIPTSLGRHIQLLFWPQKLTLYQSFSNFRWSYYFLDVFFLMLMLAGIAYGFRKNRKIFFWLSFVLVALSATLTPFRLGWWVAERYIYLGSLGFFVVFATLFDFLLSRVKHPKVIWSVFFAIVLALSVRTVARNFDWKDADTLWEATARYSVVEQKSYNNMGEVYARQGDMEKAVKQFETAIEINPRYGDAYYNLAKILDQMGKTEEAIKNFEKAVALNPGLWQSYLNLGMIHARQEKYALAKEEMQKALEFDPENKIIRENLEKIDTILQFENQNR